MAERYIFYSRVRSVERVSKVVRVIKNADDSTTAEKQDLGWFLRLEGSYEALHIGFGEEPPAFRVGERVRIIVEGA